MKAKEAVKLFKDTGVLVKEVAQIENRHNCPKALWRKFSERRKVVYNNIRGIKKDLIIHPKTEISDKEFATISHNFACLAAWEVD